MNQYDPVYYGKCITTSQHQLLNNYTKTDSEITVRINPVFSPSDLTTWKILLAIMMATSLTNLCWK